MTTIGGRVGTRNVKQAPIFITDIIYRIFCMKAYANVYVDFCEHNLLPLAPHIVVMPWCNFRYLPDLAVVNINEQLRFPRLKRLQFQGMARLIRLADKGHGSYISFFLTNVILGEHDLQNAPGRMCVRVLICWKDTIYAYLCLFHLIEFILSHRMFYRLAMGICGGRRRCQSDCTTTVVVLLVAYWFYQPHQLQQATIPLTLKTIRRSFFHHPDISCEALKACIDLVCVLDLCVGEAVSPSLWHPASQDWSYTTHLLFAWSLVSRSSHSHRSWCWCPPYQLRRPGMQAEQTSNMHAKKGAKTDSLMESCRVTRVDIVI